MTEEWQPPEDAIPWIVCAACRCMGELIAGPRHFDQTMRKNINLIQCAKGNAYEWNWEQGFIDQWGRFHTREEAMFIVKGSGQPFNIERNGGRDTELFSEGLY